MVRKNRKAWLRVVEAFLASLLILGAVLFIMSDVVPQKDISQEVYEKQRNVLESISEDSELRGDVLDDNISEVKSFISKNVPYSWNYSINICPLYSVCSNPAGIYNKEVYVNEIVISSTLTEYNPRKLKFFVWEKG